MVKTNVQQDLIYRLSHSNKIWHMTLVCRLLSIDSDHCTTLSTSLPALSVRLLIRELGHVRATAAMSSPHLPQHCHHLKLALSKIINTEKKGRGGGNFTPCKKMKTMELKTHTHRHEELVPCTGLTGGGRGRGRGPYSVCCLP